MMKTATQHFLASLNSLSRKQRATLVLTVFLGSWVGFCILRALNQGAPVIYGVVMAVALPVAFIAVCVVILKVGNWVMRGTGPEHPDDKFIREMDQRIERNRRQFEELKEQWEREKTIRETNAKLQSQLQACGRHQNQ